MVMFALQNKAAEIQRANRTNFIVNDNQLKLYQLTREQRTTNSNIIKVV